MIEIYKVIVKFDNDDEKMVKWKMQKKLNWASCFYW